MQRNLLVVGATGRTGGYTTGLLLERGHRVRALVRGLDGRAERLAALGADVVEGDVLDLDSLAEVTKGIDALYFTYPIRPGLMDATANVGQAAEENGVQAIVNMSQISARRDTASNAARQHWVAERVLDRSPVPVTHLRPTFFAEWLINMWDGSGTLRFPFAGGRHAPIAASDQAKVIAAVLEDPAPHAGQIYPLYGAEELDHYEIAEKMSRALDRKVTYVPIELDEFKAILEQRGTSPHMIQHLLAVAIDYRNGVFSGMNDLVKTIGGVAPLDVQGFVAQNRSFYDNYSA
ncbi:NmrA family NAD(P)-binding protein [Streptomyces fuscichromogenes]|uniref:NmrA family transcriptional regulator n=1 Tax=Streptomyces fuscichromogenes TaxID=1324013 RepID=A0A917XBB6_9ACTN|nr:NAD(P)H-binding protein [Streptomyces fuscichromogenes]GGN05116.1 NmrA family transcriptional regulator [Streptomyces fuscichromogenes]